MGGIYDWNLATVPQPQLDGASRPLPQGKVLGGGSILNAMCWNRGGQDDYNAWADLGNPGWDWAGLLPYFMKVMIWILHHQYVSLIREMAERDVYSGLFCRHCSPVLDQL